jgi:hypothetical protein
VDVTITRDRKQRTIHLGQPDYIEHLVNKFQMTSCFPKSVLVDPGIHLIKPTGESPTDTAFPYREADGCLLYLALKAADLGNRVRPSVLTRVLDLQMRVCHWYKIDTETLKKYLQIMGKLGLVD